MKEKLGPGRANEADQLREALKEHVNVGSWFEAGNMSLYSRNRRAIQEYYDYFEDKEEKVAPFVIWLAGPPGFGKSYWC